MTKTKLRKSEPIVIGKLLPSVIAGLKSKSPDIGEEAHVVTATEKLNSFSMDLIRQVPSRFRPFINEPVQDQDIARLKAGDIVTILGDVGVGKTTLAFRLAYRYLLTIFSERGLDKSKIKFQLKTSDEFIFEMRSAYGRDAAEDTRNIYRRGNLIFLDDLFSTMITDSVHEEILHLINYRSAWMGPMIITTNKTLNELANIDARIPSRLKAGVVIGLDGSDKRLQKPKGETIFF